MQSFVEPVHHAAQATRRLTLYGGVVRFHPIVQNLWELVQALDGPQQAQAESGWELARRLCWHLWEHAAGYSPGLSFANGHQSPWLPWLVEAILCDDNPFTRACAAARGQKPVPQPLAQAAAEDLRRLQALAQLTGPQLARAMAQQGMEWPEALLSGPEQVAVSSPACRPVREMVLELHEAFRTSSDWGNLVGALVRYHGAAGAGALARFAVFRWHPQPTPGQPLLGDGWGPLMGVMRPDPVRLEDLVGYEAERGRVVTNTRRFVAGFPAHHLLLYGPRGTGKSATVKALAHAFCDQGLRLVELPRAHLGDLPQVVRMLAERPQRFVVFVDDLSFEESEGLHRELKAALEGTVEQWPDNVVVYATSNRRHLVQERPMEDGLARPQDELNERISLADRFAVTVIFPAADQELYLRIVEELAARAGLALPRDELRQRALRWALWHNERSPRTAHQFIEELMGELGVARPARVAP